MSDVIERSRGKEGQRRITVNFPPAAAAALAELLALSRLEENSHVIVAAIECYLEVLAVDRGRGQIFVKDRDSLGDPYKYSPDTEFRYTKYQSKRRQLASCTEASAPRNFSFSDDVIKKIEVAQRLSRFPTMADVIRAALASFHELVQVWRDGDEIYIQDLKDNIVPYNPFFPVPLAALALDTTHIKELIN
jgi:hypothetical protein